jgi:hypothetical protein
VTDAQTATVDSAQSADEAELRNLNDNYVRSYLESDVDWYDRVLVDDYTCTLGSGQVLSKQEFLEETAEGPDTETFSIDELNIRIYGDAALLDAVTSWVGTDGIAGRGLYTDTYVRIDGQWRCVAANLTPLRD